MTAPHIALQRSRVWLEELVQLSEDARHIQLDEMDFLNACAILRLTQERLRDNLLVILVARDVAASEIPAAPVIPSTAINQETPA